MAGEQRDILLADYILSVVVMQMSRHLLSLSCALSTEKDMRAIYLQSVRSPAGGGRFKLTSQRDVSAREYVFCACAMFVVVVRQCLR